MRRTIFPSDNARVIVVIEIGSRWKVRGLKVRINRYNWFTFICASVIRIIKRQQKPRRALSRGESKLIYQTDLSSRYVSHRARGERRINSRQCGYANRLPSPNSGNRSINRGNKLVFDNITVKALAPGGASKSVKRERVTSVPEVGFGRRESSRSKEPSSLLEPGSLSLKDPSSHFTR